MHSALCIISSCEHEAYMLKFRNICMMQARGDAIVQCCDALCALLNGSPDNHLAVSQSGSSAKVVEVLATLSSIPLDKHSVSVRLRIDDACDHLVALLSVFCRYEYLLHAVWFAVLHTTYLDPNPCSFSCKSFEVN